MKRTAIDYVEKILLDQFHWKVRFGAIPVMLCDGNTANVTRKALNRLVAKGVLEHNEKVDGYKLRGGK
jgi:hypothetical protein